MTRLPRLAEGPLRRALRALPVVVVTGPRQAGKSTLVRMLPEPPRRSYFTLDDLAVQEQLRRDPDDVLRAAPHVTLDEVQRSPELLLAVKRAVDDERKPGRFILTGSANLLLMSRVAESLAGRASYLTLLPLTRREQLGMGAAGAWSRLVEAPDGEWLDVLESEEAHEEDWRNLARRGGYPTPSHEMKDVEARAAWFEGYERTFLERDLRDLAAIGHLSDFRRVMRATCLRVGGLLNQSELARDVAVSQPTTHRYLSLLETSHQLVQVPAFAVNRTKRLMKRPKVYWTDTGLALHVGGEEAPRGAHLENLVLLDLLAWRETIVPRPEILHWRTVAGSEVDFVLESKRRLIPIEVKASARPSLRDCQGLVEFRRDYGPAARPGLLLHCGRETRWMLDGILATPWWRVI